MSIYVGDSSSDPAFLCSNRGWDDFCYWVHHLDVEDYRELIHLREYGWSQNLPLLRNQMEQALQQEEPRGDVKEIAVALMSLLAGEGAIVITDGMAPLTDSNP